MLVQNPKNSAYREQQKRVLKMKLASLKTLKIVSTLSEEAIKQKQLGIICPERELTCWVEDSVKFSH